MPDRETLATMLLIWMMTTLRTHRDTSDCAFPDRIAVVAVMARLPSAFTS